MSAENRTSNERARPDRKLWPLTAEGDNLFNHELQMWQYEEIERLQKRVAGLEAMDAAAATHVESLICLRTHFTGEPPYVGWEGLGLALREALDERDSYIQRAAELERLAEEERALSRAGFRAARDAAEPESGHWYAAEDIDRLVRELDVLINGEAGAAKQAKLCDIVAQVRRARASEPPDAILAIEELKNLVNAQRFDRDSFANDTEFAEWALSRARYTLGLIERASETKSAGSCCDINASYPGKHRGGCPDETGESP